MHPGHYVVRFRRVGNFIPCEHLHHQRNSPVVFRPGKQRFVFGFVKQKIVHHKAGPAYCIPDGLINGYVDGRFGIAVHDDKPQNIEQAMWQEYWPLVAHRKWKARLQPPQHFIIAVGSQKEPLHFSKVGAPEFLHSVAESQIYPGKNVNRVAQRDWL